MRSPRDRPSIVGLFDGAGESTRSHAAAAAAALGASVEPTTHWTPHLALATLPGGPASDGGLITTLVGHLYHQDRLRAESRLPGEAPVEQHLASTYRRLGPKVLDLISGNFILLLWDEQSRSGLLAQDQVGGHTLYHSTKGSRLYFSSDVRSLLRLLPSRPEPDELSLTHLLVNSDPSLERTVYAGVSRLFAGHVLELGGRGWKRRCYWSPTYREPTLSTPAEIQEAYWATVSRSVHARLEGSSRPGIIMSGGVDSTVTATAAMEGAALGLPTPTGYSAVFPGQPKLDESERIDQLTEHLGLNSVQMEPTPGGVIPVLLDFLQTWDVPLSGPGLTLERPLLEHASADGVDILLDGQGGDEVFGLSAYLVADRVRRGRMLSSFRLARSFPLLRPRPPLRWTYSIWKMFGLSGAMPHALTRALERRASEKSLHYLTPESRRMVLETDGRSDWKKNPEGPLWWAYKSDIMLKGRERVYLPEYLRYRADMFGMEARPPFLDLELVEFALSYPPQLDFDARYDRPNIRGALAGRVPDSLRLDRRKSNLGPFYHAGWIGPDLPAVRRILLDPGAEVNRYVQPGTTEALLSSPPSIKDRGWPDFDTRVWGLLVVECFLRHYRDPGFADELLSSGELARPGGRLVRSG